jgi:hypothetical protein
MQMAGSVCDRKIRYSCIYYCVEVYVRIDTVPRGGINSYTKVVGSSMIRLRPTTLRYENERVVLCC